MSSKNITNVSASITARIKNWAVANSQTYQHALTRYATERFFARLEASDFSDRLVLKGGNLFVVWFSGKDYRPTMDTDFLCRGHEMTEEQIVSVFVKICSSLPSDDGLVFDSDSIKVDAIREDTKYGGWRITMKVYLGSVRIPLQFDIGFGDAVTPEPEMVAFPSMLSDVSPRIMAYPMVTMLAEKCAIMVELGFANSRMKDFFDVWMVLNGFEISEDILKTAIAATFKRRGTRIDIAEPLCFTEEFSSDERKSIQWKSYLRKNGINADCPGEFKEIADFIASKISSSIRELEGALNRISAHTILMNEAPTLSNIRKILADILAVNTKPLDIQDIKKTVAEKWGVSVSDIDSEKKQKDIVIPRQVAMYIAKNLTSKSLPEIGKNFGGRDHATVIYAVKKVRELMIANPRLENLIKETEQICSNL